MRIRLIIFQILAIAVTINLNSIAAVTSAKKGVLDMRGISSNNKFIVKLNGEWEFYWKKMLHPNDFASAAIKPDYFGNVPSYWTNYPKESVKTEKFGFATYRLTVLLPPGFDLPLAAEMPVFDSSYDIYINGKYLGGNGTTGKSAAESKPEYKKNMLRFTPESDTIEIVINVSNYSHRRGGFWLPMRLGTLQEVQNQLSNRWAVEWSVISMLLGFSIFFFFFFAISPKERIMGFLSMTTIGLALRPLFTSHFLILNIINMDWVWIVRFEYTGLFIIVIGWSWFIVNLYPSVFMKILAWINTVFYFLAFIATLLLPVNIFSYIILVYHPSMLLLIAYLLYKSFIGVLKKNIIDILYFSSFILLMIGGIHDIKVAGGTSVSSTGYLLTYLIVVFVFLQAGLLLFKWTRAFNEKEKLQFELEYMNRNLEILVNERTQELKNRNEEIEKKNSRIELQNKQLSDTINLKNRIFFLNFYSLVYTKDFTVFQFLSGTHKGPTAISRTITLKSAFETLPEAMEPKLSRTNQANIP